ncbi:MAG: hypothetical protein M1813_005245 [Trichoglossum hirsutum]|nr:MAG: hypothetical protein M1813_005245 [Trichoglossum hirsutum]
MSGLEIVPIVAGFLSGTYSVIQLTKLLKEKIQQRKRNPSGSGSRQADAVTDLERSLGLRELREEYASYIGLVRLYQGNRLRAILNIGSNPRPGITYVVGIDLAALERRGLAQQRLTALPSAPTPRPPLTSLGVVGAVDGLGSCTSATLYGLFRDFRFDDLARRTSGGSFSCRRCLQDIWPATLVVDRATTVWIDPTGLLKAHCPDRTWVCMWDGSDCRQRRFAEKKELLCHLWDEHAPEDGNGGWTVHGPTDWRKSVEKCGYGLEFQGQLMRPSGLPTGGFVAPRVA